MFVFLLTTMKRGPVVLMTCCRQGRLAMGGSLAGWFVYGALGWL